VSGSVWRITTTTAEFHPLPSGEIGYDILLADCDPKLVKMELDLYWITKGGRDPLEYFAKWPSRFPLVHVKDMAGNGEMTAGGSGPHRFQAGSSRSVVMRAYEHFYVEYDNPRSPIADIKVSFDYMVRLDL
jgi:sugar phosphate isomerase/epimerase